MIDGSRSRGECVSYCLDATLLRRPDKTALARCERAVGPVASRLAKDEAQRLVTSTVPSNAIPVATTSAKARLFLNRAERLFSGGDQFLPRG